MSATQPDTDAQTQTESEDEYRDRLPSTLVLGSTIRSVRHTYNDGNGERDPKMAVLPDGRHTGRVFTAGALTNVEDVSNESDEPFIKAEVIAGDEKIFVMAGQYQPKCRAMLQTLDEENDLSVMPAFLGITGKIRTYENDGTTYANIRPSSLTEINRDSYNRFCLQAAEDTIEASADTLAKVRNGDHSTEMMVWQQNHDESEVEAIIENIQENVLDNLN